MTDQPDTADTIARLPKHYLLSLPLALKRIEELEGENARLSAENAEVTKIIEDQSYEMDLLRRIIDSLAARVKQQSDLLTARAERKESDVQSS